MSARRSLDRMQMARDRDPETGVINHANLFLLIDRDGRLAYRLGLGERQQSLDGPAGGIGGSSAPAPRR